MNFRLTAILFGAVFVVGVVLLIMSFGGGDKEVPPDVLAAELVRAGVKADDIDAVEFEKADGSVLRMARTDKERRTWQIEKPISARADFAKIAPVITALLKAKPTPYKELRSDPAVHALAPAGLKVTIRQGAEKASTVSLGAVTGGDRGVVFVTTSAQSRPMAVFRADLDALFRDDGKGDLAADLTKWAADFRATAVFPSDAAARGQDVASIKLELPNKKAAVALTQTASGGWKFDAPFAGADADPDGDPVGAPDKFSGVTPLLGVLTNLSAGTAADFIDAPGDLKPYGLNPDFADRVRVEMKTKDGQAVVVFLGKFEPGAVEKLPPGLPPGHAPTGAGGKVYLQIEGQSGVIRAATSNNLAGLVPAIADPAALRERNLFAPARGKTVDGIDLIPAGTTPDKPIKLRNISGAWKLYGGPGDPQIANAKVVSEMVAVLTARRSIKDFPAPTPANFAAISATAYVWVDGFNPPGADPKAEPTKRGEPVKLEFGRKDGETIYVRRTLPGGLVGEFAVTAAVRTDTSLVPVDLLSAVLKARLDLLDRSLASFSDATPTRIAAAGAGNYTIAREQTPGVLDPAWRFAAPDPRAGQFADGAPVRNDIIYVLANLSSQLDKFVWEGDEPAKLAEYGFTPVPQLKVTVDLPPEAGAAGAKPVVFEFGKAATDPEKVYARQVGRAVVFTVPKAAMTRLATPDLRDRTVFRDVPAARVNVIEVTGWGGIGLKFEKNVAGVWEGKPPTPPAFAVDPARVAAFLDLVARTTVKEFQKGPPDPKQGFGDLKQTLDVTLRWPPDPAKKDDKGGEVRLIVAASPDAGATYYVSVPRLPADGSVFTVEGLQWKPFKEGSAAFVK